jgi:SAM-dependent methyltransferase
MTTDTYPDMPMLRGPVAMSHFIMRSYLHDSGRAIDATCGNGSDTLLMAGIVGESGRVWAFDIQHSAIDRTAQRLAEAGLDARVDVICGGHETMSEHVTETVNLIMFNLGYLPGGDRSIITRPETTGPALEMALACLKPGGVLALTIYPGHNGGKQEQHLVDSWAAGLDPRSCHAWRMGQTNAAPDAPYFMLIQKAG